MLLGSQIRVLGRMRRKEYSLGTLIQYQKTNSFISYLALYMFKLTSIVLRFLSFLILYCLCYYRCPNVFPFAPLYSAQSLTPTVSSPHRCPCPWVMHKCSVTSPFTCFQPVPTSPCPLVAVSLFHVSMPLIYFCSLVYFVH